MSILLIAMHAHRRRSAETAFVQHRRDVAIATTLGEATTSLRDGQVTHVLLDEAFIIALSADASLAALRGAMKGKKVVIARLGKRPVWSGIGRIMDVSMNAPGQWKAAVAALLAK